MRFGALRGNLAKMTRVASEVAEARCGLAAFTEQVLPGYPTEDLVKWPGFVRAQFQALRDFARATEKLPFPTVFTVGLTVTERGLLYNAVAVVAAGEIVGIVPKENLPNYDVFYERRVFALGIPRRVSALEGANQELLDMRQRLARAFW